MGSTMIVGRKIWRNIYCAWVEDIGYWQKVRRQCSEEERNQFIRNTWEREALLTTLLENEYSQVKSLVTSNEIWKALESTFEGNDDAKRMRLWNWICAFQDDRMMEDEYLRS